jgi:hypothetical protein
MREIQTVGEHIFWSYANLARAQAALEDGVDKYDSRHHIIREVQFRDLKSGAKFMRPLYDDERLEKTRARGCSYCGCSDKHSLTLDHIIPRIEGGLDEGDNLIVACRSCNSSKQGKDMLQWMYDNQMFPALLLLRRYLKIVRRYCDNKHLMDTLLSGTSTMRLPFDLAPLPYETGRDDGRPEYPELAEMTLWVSPRKNKRTKVK